MTPISRTPHTAPFPLTARHGHGYRFSVEWVVWVSVLLKESRMDARSRCPRCKGSIQAFSGGYRCSACGTEYPVRLGVPVFIPGTVIEASGFEMPDELAAQ